MAESEKPKPKSDKPFIHPNIGLYSGEPEEISEHIGYLRALVGGEAVKQKKAELERLDRELFSKRLFSYMMQAWDCENMFVRPDYSNGWKYMGNGKEIIMPKKTEAVMIVEPDFETE